MRAHQAFFQGRQAGRKGVGDVGLINFITCTHSRSKRKHGKCGLVMFVLFCFEAK